jgi:transcriptional regulator with XRE-family HTH domain
MPRITGSHTEQEKRTLGARIGQLRMEKDISQRKLAIDLDITATHLWNIENGKSLPSSELLTKIEAYFGVTPGELFDIVQAQRSITTNINGPITSSLPLETARIREGLLKGRLSQLIWDADQVISIMDTWIGEDLALLYQPFTDALTREVSIRIILTDPNTANIRGNQMKNRPMNYGSDLAQQNIATLQNWRQDWGTSWHQIQEARERARKKGSLQPSIPDYQPNKFRVHILHYIPPFSYYRFGKLAMLGLFSRLEACRNGPQLETQLFRNEERDFTQQTVLGRALIDEFQAIWQDSEELEVPDLVSPADYYPNA